MRELNWNCSDTGKSNEISEVCIGGSLNSKGPKTFCKEVLLYNKNKGDSILLMKNLKLGDVNLKYVNATEVWQNKLFWYQFIFSV